MESLVTGQGSTKREKLGQEEKFVPSTSSLSVLRCPSLSLESLCFLFHEINAFDLTEELFFFYLGLGEMLMKPFKGLCQDGNTISAFVRSLK